MAQKLKKYVDEKNRSYPNLYRDEVTLIFYVRDRAYGKISLETDQAKVAIPKIYTALDELKRRAEKKEVTDNQNILMSDVYEKMIALKKADGIKPQTISRIETIWKNNLKPFWANLRPDEINQERVDTFKEWHQKNRKNNRTGKEVQFVNTFKYLGNLFNLSVDYGYLKREKLPKLALPKPEEKHHAKKKGRVVSHEEFLKIREHLSDRDFLLTNIAYFMGMRKMEIGSLESKRVISENGKVFIDLSEDDTKTGIPRTLPVPGFLENALLDLKAMNPHYIFAMARNPKKHIPSQTIDSAWRVAKEKAKIKDRIRFHDLRHTAATNMARAEVNPILAVTYLGMSLRTYQKTYLNLSKEDLLIISERADKLFMKAEVTK